VAFAEAGTWEPVETLTRHVVAEEPAPAPVPATPSGRTQEITYREAVKQAIRDAMIRDERVFLMGEDVGAYGGCYAVTKGLMTEFGEIASATRRCRNRASPAPASARRRRA
jgi:2-oxoisovalerate dehydrogenase E1 component